ncbi:mannitol dehydrogenase family protein [Calidifontibacter sp. DB0510]|uniref:Mannitol-1-phosphate 5-dehydrogenase n=1 Tax=Metallococcus carri TaxID=1656884 RepID=A0A967B9M5_9MICO|nr:mannitol dehydrogenase family protein [Metallococcus carri]NHN57401.1 mannitol dehydrogenase family protein [Metallococcus carri]NOP39203.1 mannitol dehydrogenase family protein [Calidifontibacter sp. DB2511S]
MSAAVPLSDATSDRLADSVARPAYDRSRVTPGIVHLGVGGFHRAHQAMYLDRLMSQGVALDWGIVGVGVLPQDDRIVQILNRQDGLYTLVEKHPDGELVPRVIGSIQRMLHAPADPEAVLAAMTDPAIRIVSLTITEGSYLVDQVTGEFEADHPSLQGDLRPDAIPATAFGFVVEALRRRRAAGTPPFTVMSCDNLPGNGDVARATMTAFARLKDAELADWMDAQVAFPNSMVDRITPVTTPQDIEQLADGFGVADGWPVVCEPFTQWVLQDRFVDGRPPWQDAGVQLVDDVVPYELMKLRLLNASHQALCYLGYLAGYRYAHEVAQDPLFAEFLLGYMGSEGRPTLPDVPGVDLAAYSRQLIERFANPQVRDTLARLCAESSDRIPKWLVPVIQADLAAGRPVERSALVVASWARYAEGVDEQGQPIDIVDHRKEAVMAAAQRQAEEPLAFLADRTLFGDLAQQPAFTTPYLQALKSLHDKGSRATLAEWVTRLR